MTQELTAPYVLGLMFEVEREAAALEAQLSEAESRAQAIDDAFTVNLVQFKKAQATVLSSLDEKELAARKLGELNGKMAPLHREIAIFQKRADALAVDMERSKGNEEARRAFRRARATQLVQIEDRTLVMKKLETDAAVFRQTVHTAETRLVAERDHERLVARELDTLQSQLPRPTLYVQRAENLLAQAHTKFFTERERATWLRTVRQSINQMLALHQALRSGRYRLDKNSEVLGGRSAGTAEALYGAVALGDVDLARRLFREATKPGLFFHQIFHVFRAWCLGLYLSDQRDALADLSGLHQFSQGARGGYAQVFLALLQRDPEMFARGFKNLVDGSWQIWQRSDTPALGVVNVPALALLRLAAMQNMPTPKLSHPSVPPELAALTSPRARR